MPFGIRPITSATNQPTRATAHITNEEDVREQEGRDCEDEAKERHQARLSYGAVDLEVHGMIALAAEEFRIRVRDEKRVRDEVSAVAQHAREKEMQILGRAAHDEDDEPVDDRAAASCQGPDVLPDEMWDQQQEAEENGQPRAFEIVEDDQPDRVRLGLLLRRGRRLNRRESESDSTGVRSESDSTGVSSESEGGSCSLTPGDPNGAPSLGMDEIAACADH